MTNARHLLRGLLAATAAVVLLGGPASAAYLHRYPVHGLAVAGQNTDRPVAWTPTTDLEQASQGAVFSRVLVAACNPDNDSITYTVQGGRCPHHSALVGRRQPRADHHPLVTPWCGCDGKGRTLGPPFSRPRTGGSCRLFC